MFVPLLIALVSYFFLPPLVALFRQRIQGFPDYVELDMDALDPDQAHFIRSHTLALIDLGFEEPTLLSIPNAVTHVDLFVVMLNHRGHGDMVMTAGLVATGPGVVEEEWYVEFCTRFSSGEVFDTASNSVLHSQPAMPMTVRTQLPNVRQPAELHRLHRAVIADQSPEGKPVVYPPGTALTYLHESVFLNYFRFQVANGILYETSDGDFRPTWYGAFRMSWSLIQPVAAIRRWQIRRAERALLRKHPPDDR